MSDELAGDNSDGGMDVDFHEDDDDQDSNINVSIDAEADDDDEEAGGQEGFIDDVSSGRKHGVLGQDDNHEGKRPCAPLCLLAHTSEHNAIRCQH